jgi:hypothetical protein
MAQFRVTIRYGGRGQRYHVLDVEAETVVGALRRVVEAFPAEVEPTADLVEVRLLLEPAEREYGPG